METFTPLTAAIGGLLIGLASVGYLYLQGRYCGISGMVSDLWLRHPNYKFSSFFLLGLMIGGALLNWVYPKGLDLIFFLPLPGVLLAGFLVGFGAKLGGGCTSGHGICGCGMLNKRSIVAVVVFVSVAMMIATIVYHNFAGVR